MSKSRIIKSFPIFKPLLLLVLLTIISNCVSSPMPGLILSRTKQHLAPGTTSGVKIQSVRILKSGRSCSVGSWLYLAYFYYGGGGSIQEAMQEGGIQNIASIDRESFSLFSGLYYQECTVVWGE